MKVTLFIFVYLLGYGGVYSQEINCVVKQKELSEYVSQYKFKLANELLPILRKKCPSHSEEIYLLGITVLQNNIDVASETTKEAAVRDLLKLYDQYDANFPQNTNGNSVLKAMTLYDNKISDEKEIYTCLNKAFTSDKAHFSNPKAVFIYFQLFYANYKNNKVGFSFDQLLEKYNEVQTVIEKNSLAFPKKAEEFKNADRACASLMKDNLIPEKLIPYAEKNYEANIQKAEWLETMATLLSLKCAASPIFGIIAAQLHQLKPTAKSAYHIANFNLKNRNSKQALDYFNQSATLTVDKNEKAKIYYTSATIIAATDKMEAREMILSALENNPNNGSYYIFLANLYSNSINECGTTVLIKKAIYQLANQTAQKAAEVEPRLKATADSLSKEYSKNNLTKAELDQIQKSGGKISIGCWIKETVQF